MKKENSAEVLPAGALPIKSDESLLSAIGFGCACFIVTFTICLPAMAPMECLTPVQASIIHTTCMATVVVVLLAAFLLGDLILNNAARILLAGSAFFVVPVAVLIVGNLGCAFPFPVFAVAAICQGIALVSLLLFWICYFSSVPGIQAALSASVGDCVGILLFVSIGSFQGGPVGTMAVVGIFFVLSCGIAYFMVSKFQASSEYWELRDQCVRKIPHKFLPYNLSMVMHGVSFGLIETMLFALGTSTTVIVNGLGIAGALFSVYYAYTVHMKPSFSITVQKISVPLIVVSLLLAPFFEGTSRALVLSLTIICFALEMVIFWSNTASMCYEFHYHPIRWFSYRQIADWVGLVFGCGAGSILMHTVGFAGTPFSALVAGVVILVVTFFAFASSDKDMPNEEASYAVDSLDNKEAAGGKPELLIAPHGKNANDTVDVLPCEKASSISGANESSSQTHRKTATTSDFSSGTARLSTQPASSPEAPAANEGDDQANAFVQRCQAVASMFKLTRRETEVFELLCRGRNARAIQKKLFIAESTAKTHIYNIYRKMGINTQQELMDIFESISEDEAAGH